MKKSFWLWGAAVTVLSINTATAEDFEYRPFIGAEYSYVNGVADGMRPNYNAGSIVVGTDYNRYFSTEVFYLHSDRDSKNNRNLGETKTSFQAGGLDITGYLPLLCDRDLALLGTAGIGMYRFRTKYHNPALKGGFDSGYGYRIGAGIHYGIDNNWSLRAVARYVGLDKIKNYDHMTEYTLGIRYAF